MRKFVLSAALGAAMCAGSAWAEIVVHEAPPHDRAEHRPGRPSGRHVWIGGYHRWDGHAYVWEPGRWDLPPREHAVWVAPRWRHRHGDWVFIEGHWK
jgi:hypothetical protein